jgi:hypothetical protein
MVYSFHKYWNANDMGAINYLLALRTNTNRPLWLGESGENSNPWFTDCITMMENNNIGWAWWTLKKFDAIAGPFSVPNTPEYENLLKYWKGQSAKPTVAASMKGLMGMAEGLKLQNCTFRPDVIDALIRQPKENTGLPFAANAVPGKIFAVNYDLGKNLVAYKDNDIQNNQNNGAAWNSGWSFRNDGVDIERCTDAVNNGYNVGWTGSGEYLTFTINVQQNGKYNIAGRFAAPNTGGSVGVSIDGSPLNVVNVLATGGYQSWGTQGLGQYEMTAGTHLLKTAFFFGGFNVNYFDIQYLGPMTVKENGPIPDRFELAQNYPNPFNPSTTVDYAVTSGGPVTLQVFDMLGRHVSTLVEKVQFPGKYSVKIDASNMSSGVYYYQLRAGAYRQSRTMTVLK